MLQHFTWQQFLIASMVLSLIWYLGVILIFYRSEFLRFFKRDGTSSSLEKLPHRWEDKVDLLQEELQEDELMGKAKLPDGLSSVTLGSFGFAPSEKDKADQVGLIHDLLQEIKEVFSLIEREDFTKKDLLNLLEVVKGNYPKIGSHPNIGRINQFISNHVPFHLSSDELENLWD
ncbi:hypothetical protein [Pedobacter rhodius]|uniref:Uncharacterized protein n=1 Tax=Pedobacter rhodius TaxID=3004098 RepID=A0ABT4KXM7_9SPHI|nr:hypothetical protein [Pedobacter sp. SJ11]MCZ4223525.1 hypothetical protein [Pedobacter sp. SJ11]